MRTWLLCLLLLPVAHAEPMLVAVVPDLPGSWDGDEAVAIADPMGGSLAGYSLSDGEDTWPLPPIELAPGQEAWFVGNASAWRAHDGPEPAGIMDLRLANDGDNVELIGPVVDGMAYGGGTSMYMAGAIRGGGDAVMFRRVVDADGFVDTDTYADWQTPRIHRVGESDHGSPTFQVDLTLYRSPDNSYEVLSGMIQSATERLHLHVYDLRHPQLVDALVAQKRTYPDLDLQVLVEDRVVGHDAFDRSQVAEGLQRIQDVGGQAFLAGSTRYSHHHLKVLVADDAVAVQTENWVHSGVPIDPTTGNRGMGVVLHDEAAADWFATWMQQDRDAWDTTEFVLDVYDPGHRSPPRFPVDVGTYSPRPSQSFDDVTVQVFLSPEHTAGDDEAIRLAASAQQRLVVQQLRLESESKNRLGWQAPNALMAAIEQAHDNGARVTVLAAAPFGSDDDNAEPIQRLRQQGIDAARFDVPGLTLHSKAVVADDAFFVGSMNGNHHSRSANREVGVLVFDARVADAAAAWMEADHEASIDTGWPAPWEVAAPAPSLIALALLGLSWCSRRIR